MRALCILAMLALVGGVAGAATVRSPFRGEVITYGVPRVGDIALGIGAHVAVLDWDGDGGLDLLANASHRAYGPGACLLRDLGATASPPPYSSPIKGEEVSAQAHLYAEPLPIKDLPPGATPLPAELGLGDFVTPDAKVFRVDRRAQPPRVTPAGTLASPRGPIAGSQIAFMRHRGGWSALAGQGHGEYWPGNASPWDDRTTAVGFKTGYQDGRWKGGEPHARILFWRRTAQGWADPVALKLESGEEIDVYGIGAPTAADGDGDGDEDLFVGNFLDQVLYFENVGGDPPLFRARGPIRGPDGAPLRIGVCLTYPRAVDFDGDGLTDLLVASEDGRIYLVRCLGRAPLRFDTPRPLQQRNAPLAAGALAVPTAADLDGDGKFDLVVGDSGGYLRYYRNLGDNDHPVFALPELLSAGGRTFRIEAGPTGAIQGPEEACWGYTAPEAADWDGDGDVDLLVGNITYRHYFLENIGTAREPRFAAPRPLRLTGGPLETVTRVRPSADDWTGDGRLDYLCLDNAGLLTVFPQSAASPLELEPGIPLVWADTGDLVKLDGVSGHSGRIKLEAVDWDGDGDLDILYGMHSGQLPREYRRLGQATVLLLVNEGRDERGSWRFRRPALVLSRDGKPMLFGGHSCAPVVVRWGKERRLLVGSETGRLYW